MKDKFIIAIKDTSGNEIKPGKVLGKFRKLDFAKTAYPAVVDKSCLPYWRIAIFQNGKIVN